MHPHLPVQWLQVVRERPREDCPATDVGVGSPPHDPGTISPSGISMIRSVPTTTRRNRRDAAIGAAHPRRTSSPATPIAHAHRPRRLHGVQASSLGTA